MDVNRSDSFAKHYDTALNTILRPHQLQAVHFLLLRLLGEDVEQPNDQQAEDMNSDIPLTGAILADDMGTGKTLTALAVLWCLCRHGKGKAVIVCPSTLVDNWKAELKKWFPKNLDRTALFINGSNRSSGAKGTDSVIESFATSHPAMRPLLVLSYDMFRIYANVLNDITTFNTIICDEGHKIKNALGTKTTLALGNCCAMQRLVLTGTPIQNNLNELFAVVQFAAPGYLGDLKEFQTKYSDPITKHSTSSPLAVRAKERLRAALRRLLLRRDRDAILKSVLPPRIVTGVVCLMAGRQEDMYKSECAIISRGVSDVNDSEEDAISLHVSKHQCVDSNAFSRTMRGSCTNVDSNMMVLSKLLSLRQICSVPTISSADKEIVDLAAHLENSVKLRVLDALLTELRKSRPTERVVIVSNFITTLDAIHLLAKRRRYLTLRLDGDVAADKRQNIVNHFNNPKEPFFLMLLSAKAGGVGLNLTGATRLVLWEPDWNPSTDEQAMARVWRDGQTKNCFIYRMIAHNSIEETILQRQSQKNELHTVITERENAASAETSNDKKRDASECETLMLLPDVSAISQMILPRGKSRETDNSDESTTIQHKDDILDLLPVHERADIYYATDMS